MNINVIIYLIIFIGGACASLNGSLKAKKTYVIICVLVFLLLNSLRSLTVGADTENYYYMFLHMKSLTWSEIWQTFVERYYYGISEDDIGYVLLVKAISYITQDFHVFTFIAESLFFIPLGVLLYKYSRNCIHLVLAFSLYGALLNAIPITNCRQTYAFGLCIITIIMYLENYHRRFIPLVILIAATIHLSALLFFLPYILVRFAKKLRSFHIISLILVPAVLADPNKIIRLMGNMSGKEQYASYGENGVAGGANTFVFLLFLLSIYILISFYKAKLSEADNKTIMLYTMAPLFTFFGPLIVSNGTMIRISMYFHIYLVLLLPEATSFRFSRNSNIINILMALILVYLSLSNSSNEYYFFWEIDPVTTW